MLDNFTSQFKSENRSRKNKPICSHFCWFTLKTFCFYFTHDTIFLPLTERNIYWSSVNCLWNNQSWNEYLLFFSVSGTCRIPKRLFLYTVFNFKLTLTKEINRQKLCIWTNNQTEMFLCRFSMRFKKSKTSNTGHSMSETKFTWQRTKSLIFDNFVLSLGIKLINYRLFSGFIR